MMLYLTNCYNTIIKQDRKSKDKKKKKKYNRVCIVIFYVYFCYRETYNMRSNKTNYNIITIYNKLEIRECESSNAVMHHSEFL